MLYRYCALHYIYTYGMESEREKTENKQEREEVPMEKEASFILGVAFNFRLLEGGDICRGISLPQS